MRYTRLGSSGRTADRARPAHDASGHAVAGPIPVSSMASRHDDHGRG
jgi:hypothetical protein